MIACGKASVIKHTRSSVWEAWGPPPSRQLEQKNRKPVLLSTHTPLPTSLGYWRHPRTLLLPPRWGPKWGERWDKGPRRAQPPAQGGLSWYFLIHVPPRPWLSLPSPLAPTPGFLPSPPSIRTAFSHTLSPHLLTLKLAWSLWRFLPRGLMTGDAVR